jgi:hypothetical protein
MRFILLVVIHFFAFANSPIAISFGPVNVGEKRIDINLNNFELYKRVGHKKIKASIVADSTQWVRTQGNLLTPRALVEIVIQSEKTISIKHHEKVLIPAGKKTKTVQLYLNIFNPSSIEIYEDDKRIESLRLASKISLRNSQGHLKDYSCAPFNLNIDGLDDQYVSVGCTKEKYGKVGSERQRLIITWATTNYFITDELSSPFTTILSDNEPIIVTLRNHKGEKRNIKLQAKMKQRAHRLKTAFGLGPYMFKTNLGTQQRDPVVAPAAMLYAKWDLTDISSLRAFDALVAQTSIFNNAGLYFAYEVASAFDNRVKFVPLLGLQVLTFKFDRDRSDFNEVIYPQGMEIVYQHAFGIENYHIIAGAFLSPQTSVDYTNLWLRWGSRYFWELNYIGFAADNKKAHMWGLSIGFPLGSYF